MRAVTAWTLALVVLGFADADARAENNPDVKLAMHLVASAQYLYCDDLIASACSGIDPDLSIGELAASGYQGYVVFLAYDLETCISGVEYFVVGWPTGFGAPEFDPPGYCPPMTKTLCMGEPFEALGGGGGICAFGGCVWESSSEMAPFAYLRFNLASHTELLPITLNYSPSTYSYPADPRNYVLGPEPDYPECPVQSEHGCTIGGDVAYEDIWVLSPDGGEMWCAGETGTIRWSSFNLAGVRIESSTDGGWSWDLVADSAPATGTHAWTIPDVESENCLIRVSDAEDGVPSDASDGPFTITSDAALTVLAPNGGERWHPFATETIRWVSSCVESVVLEYSTDGGVTWESVAETESDPGIYEWEVPDEPSENCLVRATDVENATVSDQSDEPFTIGGEVVQELRVVSPNGGEGWVVGETRDIEWTSTGIGDVRIELSRDGGSTWSLVASASAGTGSYAWTVAGATSHSCRIRISDAEDGFPFDLSDGPFTIVDEATLALASPNGGEAWCAGETRNIEWTSIGVDEVRIEFSPDGGSTWDPVTLSAPATGTYAWAVSDNVSDDCRIRISDAADGIPSDLSDGPFSVVDEEGLTLLQPNGGQTWYAWCTATVRWTSTCIENVRIEYSHDGGSTWTEIVSSTPARDPFLWIVADTPSTDCLVRVSDALDGYPSDTSDAPFTIGAQSSIPGAKFAMHLVASDEYLGCEELTPADASAINRSLTLEDLVASNYCGYVVFVAYDLWMCIAGVEYCVTGWPTGRGAPRFSGPTYCPSTTLCLGQPFEALGGVGGICAFGGCEWNPEGFLHAFSFIFFDLSEYTDYLPIPIRYAPSRFSYPADPHNYVLWGTIDFDEESVVEEQGGSIGGDTPVRTSPTTWGGLKVMFRERTE